jgi:hypothetical protein
MVPIAFEAPGRPSSNPDLLAALASARRLDVRVQGDAPGELFGQAGFDLSDLKARDALYADAAAQAEAAARTPKTCQKQ